MSEPLEILHAAVRDAVAVLAEDYAVRRRAQPDWSEEAYCLHLRRMIESRAVTVDLVKEDGPMGGGGPGEA